MAEPSSTSQTTVAGGVTRDKSQSQRTETQRAADRERKAKQRERAGEPASSIGGSSRSRGNPFRWNLGPIAKAGESVSPTEATAELKHAHIAIAKVMRSRVDLDELDEEFTVAGESFATVANHIWTPLRVAIRLIAPLVLAGALIAIWAAILAETPWVQHLDDWLARRRAEDREQPTVVPESPPAPPAGGSGAWTPPHVVHEPPADEAEQPAEHPPVPNLRELRRR